MERDPHSLLSPGASAVLSRRLPRARRSRAGRALSRCGHCERERAALFGRARASSPRRASSRRGRALRCEVPGGAPRPRRRRRAARRSRNACRHRARRLVDAPCSAKAIVVPVPRLDLRPARPADPRPAPRDVRGHDCARAASAESRSPSATASSGSAPARPASSASSIADLAALGLDRHVGVKRATATRRCNWKLVVEAFLDGYHIRDAAPRSIYRFFLDARRSPSRSVRTSARSPRAARCARRRRARRRRLRSCGDAELPRVSRDRDHRHPDFVSMMTVVPASCRRDGVGARDARARATRTARRSTGTAAGR